MLPRIGRDAENATDILESGGSKPRDLGGFSSARSIKVVPPQAMLIMWLKQCHEPLMTGDDWGMVQMTLF